MDAIVTVDVKDARILGQLLGNIELMGNANTRFHLVADRKMISISGYLSADTVNFREDSLNLFGGRINVGFKYKSDPRLSVWNSGGWSVDAAVCTFCGARGSVDGCFRVWIVADGGHLGRRIIDWDG